MLKEIRGRLELLLGIGLDYLNFNRRSGTLSGGESQRIRLSTQIGSGLMGMLYVLDEPSIGLHPKDNVKMIATLESLRDIGNTVIVVEHDEDTIRAADHLVEMGPGPGVHGGHGGRAGHAERRARVQGVADRPVPLGQAIDRDAEAAAPRATARRCVVRGARENNLKNIDVTFPLGQLVAITGASGSGKSTLINEILYKALWKRLDDTRTLPGEHDARRRPRARPQGRQHRPVADRPQQPLESGDLHRLLRHHPRPLHAGAALGRARLQARALQLQRQGRPLRGVPGRGRDHDAALLHARRRGDLRRVQGRALQQRDARGHGPRQDHRRRAEHVDRGGRRRSSRSEPAVRKKIEVLNELGLGYLTLGQSATTLSGGEAQRIKIATELSKLQRSKHTVYILDEPTTGLHLADVERLLASLNRLVDAGHTVVLIEHHMDVIKTADHVIDLGPGGRARRAAGRGHRHAGGCGALQGVAHRPVSEGASEMTDTIRWGVLGTGRIGTRKVIPAMQRGRFRGRGNGVARSREGRGRGGRAGDREGPRLVRGAARRSGDRRDLQPAAEPPARAVDDPRGRGRQARAVREADRAERRRRRSS